MKYTYRVRGGLISVAALLAVLVIIRPGHSQFEPAPAPTPPVAPPTAPVMPMPPANPGGPMLPPGPRMPIGPGPRIGGPQIYQWSCGQCGRVLGTGPVPPATAYCPHCRITNTIPQPGAGGAIVPGIPGGPPAGGPLIATPAGPDPVAGPPGPAFEGGVHVPPVQSSPPSSTSPTLTRGMIVVIALGVLLLLGIGMAAVIFTIINQQNVAKRRRPRSRRRLDDDY